jgi:hypothetical protein
MVSQRMDLINREIGMVLDDILMNFEENQYLIDQFSGIKLVLSKVLTQEALPSMGSINSFPERMN